MQSLASWVPPHAATPHAHLSSLYSASAEKPLTAHYCETALTKASDDPVKEWDKNLGDLEKPVAFST